MEGIEKANASATKLDIDPPEVSNRGEGDKTPGGDAGKLSRQNAKGNEIPISEGGRTDAAEPARKSSEQTNGSPITASTIGGDIWVDQPYQVGMCDGPCMRDFDETDKGVHWCTYCYDTQICVNCFELFKKGLWLYKKCDVTHKHVFVNGPPKGLRVKNSTKVKVGGVVRERAQWLDEIRKTWDLPLKETGAA
jgi:hypothetical protein